MEFKEQPREPFFSPQNFGKILLFSALVFGCAVIQSSLFPALTLLPATPDLLLAAVMGLAVYDGERSGAVAGIGAGVLTEALSPSGIMLLPVVYMLIGYVFGIVTRIFLNKNFLSWVVYMVIACGIRSMITLTHLVINEAGLNVLTAADRILIPEYLMTLIFSVPVWLLARACARPFHKQMDMD